MVQKEYEARIRELERQNIEYIHEIAQRDGRIHELNMRLRQLEARLESDMGLRTAALNLYHGIDNKIMYVISKRGQRKKKRAFRHPEILPEGEPDYWSLIGVAREYDAKQFFVYKMRRHKHNLRFGYWVAAKGYRTVRDTGIAGVRKLANMRAGQ